MRACANVLTLVFVTAASSACHWSYRQPRVETVEYRHDVTFAPGSSALSPSSETALRQFITTLPPASPDYASQSVYVVTALVPDVSPTTRTAVIDERNSVVAGTLAALGLPAQSSTVVLASDPVLPDNVAVVVQRSIVGLPSCPDWSGSPAYSRYSNQVTSNWSCSTAVNFGMMVSNPADLQYGRPTGVASGEFLARSVQRYRDGKTKPLSSDVSTAETFAGGSSSGNSSE
ncbi:MAG: hypothetical protein HC826_01835 [Rhodospirillales bacterium]|nr:hypothetical protein [Rhodospirillales bacterium]